jgi:predicted O-methyltransferase YrrM
LLDLAVSLMTDDELYLEVGSYRGRSLVGAGTGTPGRRAVAVESFAEFGVDPDESLRAVRQTLRDHGCADQVDLVVGDAFRVLGPGLAAGPVGVYFYDGAHSRVAQHLGLAMAEPLLADRALVVVDDASWPQVASATQRYLRRHPGYQVLFEIRADEDFDPRWCNGLLVLAWQRPERWTPPGGWPVRWRRTVHLTVLEPARRLAYRLLAGRPRLTELVKRVYLHGGTTVPSRR